MVVPLLLEEPLEVTATAAAAGGESLVWREEEP